MGVYRRTGSTHIWHPWKFLRSKNLFFNNEYTLEAFVKSIEEELNIKSLKEWYKVSNETLAKLVGPTPITRCNGLQSMLTKVYPRHEWDVLKFEIKQKKSFQKYLNSLISKLLPNEELIEDYVHPSFLHEEFENAVSDIYLPSLKLAFEYQGQQHYEENITVFNIKESVNRVQKEKLKQRICQQLGITVVEVPYWWNKRKEYIATEIARVRPDIKLQLD